MDQVTPSQLCFRSQIVANAVNGAAELDNGEGHQLKTIIEDYKIDNNKWKKDDKI